MKGKCSCCRHHFQARTSRDDVLLKEIASLIMDMQWFLVCEIGLTNSMMILYFYCFVFFICRHGGNRQRNRYRDILPQDHSRVRLPVSDDLVRKF